ncbi:MAG: hypothetical protein WC900_07030 [Oscillospiraceae bacterium]
MKNMTTLKKIRKARYFISGGKMVTALKIIFLLFSAFMFAAIIRFSFWGDAASSSFVFVFNLIFMSQYLFFANAIIPNFAMQKQRSVLNGCGTLCDTMLLFPIRKNDCIRISFRAWAWASSISLLEAAILNGAVLISDKFDGNKGIFALSAIIIIAATSSSLILTMFSCIIKKKAVKWLWVFATVLYFVFMFFSIFFAEMDIMSKIYKAFSGFSGIPSLIAIVLTIPVMYILTYLLLIKRKNSEAWYNE